MKKLILPLIVLGLLVPSLFTTAATDIVTHATLTNGLISYWEMEEESGVRIDSTDTGNDLADNNTVLFGTGIILNGADFESSEDDSLSISDATQSGLDIANDFSVSIWLKKETTGVEQTFIAKYDGAGEDRSYAFVIESSDKLKLVVSSNGTLSDGNGLVFLTDAAQGQDTNFHHYVITWNMATEVAIFYVDGSPVSNTKVLGTTIEVNLHNNNDPFEISGFSASNDTDGIMDEVGIWSRPLTSGEVTDLNNGGAGLPYSVGAGATSLKKLLQAKLF